MIRGDAQRALARLGPGLSWEKSKRKSVPGVGPPRARRPTPAEPQLAPHFPPCSRDTLCCWCPASPASLSLPSHLPHLNHRASPATPSRSSLMELTALWNLLPVSLCEVNHGHSPLCVCPHRPSLTYFLFLLRLPVTGRGFIFWVALRQILCLLFQVPATLLPC